jgi:hypothetical protein
MRRTWISLLAFVGAFTVAGSCAPVISVDNANYSATVQTGSTIVHTFRLTNAGDAALSITGVQASCGCTTTVLEKSQLAPGESVGLEAKVNTAGFSGTVQKTVTVQSDDPATPNLVLHMTLTIENEIRPQPAPVASAQVPVAPTRTGAAPGSLAKAAWWPPAAVGGAGIIVGYALALVVQQVRRRGKTGDKAPTTDCKGDGRNQRQW